VLKRLRYGGLFLALSLPACERTVVHIFGGYGYDDVNDCLDAAGAVDVIDGPDPGMCATLRCWIRPDGVAVVTDRACDAPSDYVDHTKDTSGVCVKALAAYGRPGHGMCPIPADAGAEAGP
jgi:hypothetical protein